MEKRVLKLNVLFFTQYFWPENFRINELVEVYKTKNISVLTSYPSYPDHKKYKNFKKKDDANFIGSKIYRMPIFPRSNNNISIFLNYLSFIIFSFFYGLYLFVKKKIDLIFIFCPSPILSAIPIIILNKLFKKKIVIWVLDLWPDTIIDLKIIKNKYIIYILKKIVNFIYNNSDLILAQSETMKKEISSITSTKCIYFPSWPESKISDDKLTNYPNDLIKKNNDILRIMFTGNVGEAQSLETIIDTTLILKKEIKIEWLIVGDGRWKEILKKKVAQKRLEDEIKFFKSIPLSQIKSYFDQADVLYLSLKDNLTFKKTIPGKLSTYMSSGKPIIASISGEASDIIKKANCGLVSEAENSKDLAENIKKFFNFPKEYRKSLGLNGYAFSQKYFNKKKIFENLEYELKNILK